jgi:hypothetical protein
LLEQIGGDVWQVQKGGDAVGASGAFDSARRSIERLAKPMVTKIAGHAMCEISGLRVHHPVLLFLGWMAWSGNTMT